MVDKEFMRQKIIKAASTCFSAKGYKKTTMDVIARATGMRKSSLYYYYPGKEQIFDAVIVKEATMMRRLLSFSVARARNPVDQLRNYILVRMKTFQKLSNFYHAIFDETLRHFEFIEKIRVKYDEEEIHTVRKIFDEGMKSGHFRMDDSELVAIAIIRALKGLEVPLFWTHINENVDETIDEFLNILFYGIIKR